MANESQEPENQQHNKDSPEHMFSFELVYFASHARARVRVRFFKFARVGMCWRVGAETITTSLTEPTSILCAPNFSSSFFSPWFSPGALAPRSSWKNVHGRCPTSRCSS